MIIFSEWSKVFIVNQCINMFHIIYANGIVKLMCDTVLTTVRQYC